MFQQISPQKVKHSTGYIVQVIDRESVEYVDGDQRVVIQVDFGPTVGVYKQSIRNIGEQPLEAQADKITMRIVEGLEAMGCLVEVC